MAQTVTTKSGSVEIRFTDTAGNRKSIYPGKLSKRDAESWAGKIEHLVNRKLIGREPEPAVCEWLGQLPDKQYQKLAKHDLVPPRQPVELDPEPEQPDVPTVKQFTDQYISNHPAKEGTIEQLTISARSLCRFIGEDALIDSITAADAEEYHRWMLRRGNERKQYKTGLAKDTARRRIGRVKQMFRLAVKKGYISSNPFTDEKSTTGSNDSRKQMIPAETIDLLIRKAPSEDWRIILALARYGGFRAHECLIQRWEDIDLPNNKMVVRSNKTPPVRTCPIFPELRPHLIRAREMAPPGAVYVQHTYMRTNPKTKQLEPNPDANMRTTMKRILTAAKVPPWPRLMQNLRATRETELLARYPAKDVTSWLGNSPKVASQHYAMPMQESFQRAVVDGAALPGITAKTPQHPPQPMLAKGGNPETVNSGQEMKNGCNPSNVLELQPLSANVSEEGLALKLPGMGTNGQRIVEHSACEDGNTTTSTTSTTQLAHYLRQHLNRQQLAELVQALEADDHLPGRNQA